MTTLSHSHSVEFTMQLFRVWQSTVDFIKATYSANQDLNPEARRLPICSDDSLTKILAFLHALCDIDKAFTLVHDTHLYLFTLFATTYAAEKLELKSLKQTIFHTQK
jgi:hypothetical protein